MSDRDWVTEIYNHILDETMAGGAVSVKELKEWLRDEFYDAPYSMALDALVAEVTDQLRAENNIDIVADEEEGIAFKAVNPDREETDHGRTD